MKWQYWLLLFIIAAVMKLSVFAKKLTPIAALVGGVIGVCVYIGAGFTGIAMMAAFFALGTIATSWKASQVIANAGVAVIISLLVPFFPQHSVLFQVMIAAAFSSATADTLSSELGNVYGRRFYNILSLKKDQRGLDGVVSSEGTLAGVCGSIIIALIYVIGFDWNSYLFFLIVLSGTIGNLSDSVLGAAFERKGVLQNDVVNFLNTLVAALVAVLLF